MGRRFFTGGWAKVALGVALGLWLMGSPAMAGASELHAMLLNGGGNPKVNYLSHLHHLEDMLKVLETRGVPRDRISIFASDGSDKAPDLTTQSSERSHQHRWLISGTSRGKLLSTGKKIENTTMKGVKLRPARYEALRQWFKEQRDVLEPGDTLMIFVTDHGHRGPDDLDNGSIVLWEEEMSVVEFRALLSHLRPGVRVVTVMSQCFSGTFANAIYGLGQEVPDGNSCGFFATRNDRFAYGCYPEGRGRDQIGHAFQFIAAMESHDTLNQAHQQVNISDDTPDVPLRTSDLYLADLLQREAALRNQPVSEVADELLSEAWRQSGSHREDIEGIDRMASAYGLYSPRRVSEIEAAIAEIEELEKGVKKVERLWDQTYDEVLEANLERFMDAPGNNAWRKRLDPGALQKLEDPGRHDVLGDLLPKLAAFTQKQGDLWDRLATIRNRRGQISRLSYRLEIRQAILLRMKHALLRVAGEVLLERPGASMTEARRGEARQALERLEVCEDTAPGRAPGKGGDPHKPDLLGAIAAEAELLGTLLPSTLGVGYELAATTDEPGAVRVSRVVPKSAAHHAGLVEGDLILRAEGQPLLFKDHIRAWVMTSPANKALELTASRAGKPLPVKIELQRFDAELPAFKPAAIPGRPAPEIEGLKGAPDLQGARMVAFWATWCEPCRKALSELTAWSDKTGTPVMAITDESPNQLRRFRDHWGAGLPEHLLTDPERTSFSAFQVQTTPTFILIDAQGKVAWRKDGLAPGESLSLP